MSQLMREKCKFCNEPVALEVDPSAEVKIHYYKKKNQDQEDEVIVASRANKLHPWGLCYFHTKTYKGLFDLKYPLYKFTLENAKLQHNMERVVNVRKPISYVQ